MKLPQNLINALEVNLMTKEDKNFKFGTDGIYHLNISPVLCELVNKKVEIDDIIQTAGDYILKYYERTNMLYVECVGGIINDLIEYTESKKCYDLYAVVAADMNGFVLCESQYGDGYDYLWKDSDFVMNENKFELRKDN